jgi:CheY-like chemotaxis protein
MLAAALRAPRAQQLGNIHQGPTRQQRRQIVDSGNIEATLTVDTSLAMNPSETVERVLNLQSDGDIEISERDPMTQPSPYRVLLIEDDPSVARSLARVLMARGLSVDVATSCGGARALFGPYDLGIFDIELPDGLGTDLAHELTLKTKVCAVMFYTGATYQPLLRRAAELGPVVAKQGGTRSLLEAAQTRLATPRPRLKSGILTEGDVQEIDGFVQPERPTGS